jgi:activator of HSP90 ATPase
VKTFRQNVFFKGTSVDEVYDALLDPKKRSDLTGPPATTSAKVGSSFPAWEGYITGKNLELLKAKRIVREWKTSERPAGYPVSRLEIALSAKKGH